MQVKCGVALVCECSAHRDCHQQHAHPTPKQQTCFFARPIDNTPHHVLGERRNVDNAQLSQEIRSRAVRAMAEPKSDPLQQAQEARPESAEQHNDAPPKPSGNGNSVAPVAQPSPSQGWVHFEEEDAAANKQTKPDNDAPAVITTESVQVNLERSFNENLSSVIVDPKNLRNVELPMTNPPEVIRQGFANGDIIVTLLPVNTSLPWITPAKFRPELVPEELMAQGLTLTVEEYVQVMELLVNDYRFTLYNICYKRVLVVWISLAFILLLGLLFSGLTGLVLFGVGIFWLVINATAIFLSMWVKFKLQRNLERCLATVNKQLMRHKIIVALDDRGKISCHKITLCFIYLDPAQCINHLQSSVEVQERDEAGWEQRMDISVNDIVIQGSRTTRLSRKQERSTLLYLRYASRWGKERVRGYLASPPAKGGRHCAHLTCPCQYIEEHLQCKPAGKLTLKSFCCLPDQDKVINSQGRQFYY